MDCLHLLLFIWDKGLNLITTVAVVVGAIIYYHQLVQMRKATEAATISANTAKRALELCECAELQITEMNITTGVVLGPNSKFQFAYQNFGRTTASQVESKIAFRNDGVFNASVGPAIIAPGNKVYCPIDLGTMTSPFNQAEFDRINARDNPFQVIVETTYLDVFEDQHTVRYTGLFNDGAFGYTCTKSRKNKP